jgi:HEAT repeat protein
MRKFVGVMLAVIVAGCGGEPTSQGKPASYWMNELKIGRWASARWHAAQALGEIGPKAPQAVPVLTEALKDEDPVVRWAATAALWEFGPVARTAAPALRQVMEHDRVRAVREQAGASLHRIDPDGTAGR